MSRVLIGYDAITQHEFIPQTLLIFLASLLSLLCFSFSPTCPTLDYPSLSRHITDFSVLHQVCVTVFTQHQHELHARPVRRQY